jgi:hypothetical protein
VLAADKVRKSPNLVGSLAKRNNFCAISARLSMGTEDIFAVLRRLNIPKPKQGVASGTALRYFERR